MFKAGIEKYEKKYSSVPDDAHWPNDRPTSERHAGWLQNDFAHDLKVKAGIQHESI